METLGNNKLEVYEDEEYLEIGFKWFTPMAIFMAFFTVLWCGFLVFWYSMAVGGGAPLIFTLFPILHVAAGIGMGYYTLCLFFNKTFVMIENGMLHVLHQPIPWWKGNKHIPISEIEQFFVKEKITKNKDSVKRTYQLIAKLKEKGNKTLISLDGLKSEKVKEIEQRLEEHLGIEDKPMKGEYESGLSNQEATSRLQPRKQVDNFSNPTLRKVFLNNINGFFNFQGKDLLIASLIQLDWDNGNSDKVFQALDEAEQEYLIRIQQNNALLKAYKEQEMELGTAMELGFKEEENLKHVLNWQGKNYILNSNNTGKSYSSNLHGYLPSYQWLYLTSNKEKSLRIIKQGKQISYFTGDRLAIDDFSEERLDLNEQLPIKNKESLKRDWEA